jgi:hypothetical protein
MESMNADAICEVLAKVITRWLKLSFDKSAVFSICVISILVLICDAGLRAVIWSSLTDWEFYANDKSYSNGASYVALLIAGVVVYHFLASFFGILLNMHADHIVRQSMGIFALGIHGIVGITAGVEMLDSSASILAVFPIWNIVTSAAMLYLMALAPEKAVSDRDECLGGILVAALTIVALFLIVMFVAKRSSVMTMSVCVCISVSLSPCIAARFTKTTNERS